MSNNRTNHFDIIERARQAMLDAGFEPDFSSEARRQAESLQLKPVTSDVRDLRDLLWSSIDNDDSRDLDQIEAAEQLSNGDIRVLVAIADVDSLVDERTPIDLHAAFNTTSVYTGVKTFPMLPERLSTDMTSLNEGEDRRAIVTEMVVSLDGIVRSSEIYPGVVRNRAQLVYEPVGDWLENQSPPPFKVTQLPGLAQQILLQHEAAVRLTEYRRKCGTLDFESVEIQPVMKNGRVVGMIAPRKNPARLLIGNLMITANTIMATFLENKGISAIQRIVKTPERWPRIVDVAREHGDSLPSQPDSKALAAFMANQKRLNPLNYQDLSLTIVKLLGSGEYELVRGSRGLSAGKNDEQEFGHFGLALQRYTHSTAPNRRFVDLVIQRQVKTLLTTDQPPYSESALREIACHCTDRENAAQKVERLMRKVAAATLVSDRLGDIFSGIVTGASDKGTYVRVAQPPIEGRVVQRFKGLDVGQKVKVRLAGIDAQKGYIDFVGV